MKRKLIIILAIVMVTASTSGASVASAETTKAINCKSSLLMNYETGTVIAEKDADKRFPIASMCKIMTLVLAFERIDSGELDISQEVIISENASSMGGSQAFLETNCAYTLDNLIKSIVISSANDSSVAVAELISGSEESFVELMNEKSKSLGMENTNFTNCTGLPKIGQYSSARDVATMTKELISHSKYFDYSTIYMDSMPHQKGNATELVNTNKLVKFYSGCDGGKTGYTSEAKFCLSATAKRNDMRMIAVVIGADSSKERNSLIASMFNSAFGSYKMNKLLDTQNFDKNIAIRGGKIEQLPLALENDYSEFLKNNQKSNLEVVYELPQFIKAPINEGTIIGKALVLKDKAIIAEVNIIAKQTVLEKSYTDGIGDIIENW